MTFDDWIKDILKIEAREITHLTPEEQKKVYFTVSADDLIKLWNAGVENGVSGMQLKITDLEKENEQLTVSYETLKLHDEEEIGMLKSENAELKEKIKHRNCVDCSNHHINIKFFKAKKIIKKFSEFVNNEIEYDPEHPQKHTDKWNELCKQAEQFLKEIEK